MKHVLVSTIIVLVAFIAAPVSADQRKANDNDNGTVEAPRVEIKSSLTDSVRRVERQTGGEVLSAEPVQRDGRQVNRVKVLTNDGRVRVMQVDPQQNRSKKPLPAPRDRDVADKDGGDPDLF